MKTRTPTIRPLPKQEIAWEILQDKIIKYLLFGGGAGGGKSWLGCEWLMVMCYMYPESKWFIGRKELTRLMKSSFETFKKVCLFHQIPPNDWKLNGQYNYIEFFNKSKIDLLDLDEKPSDPMFERFGSLEYTGGWIEEAAEVKYKCFDVLKSRIGRHKNKEFGLHPKLLLTANPTKNWLKRIFYKRWKDKTLPKQYAFIQSLYRDNFYTSDIYGENLNEIDDLITRQRLRDGNWDYDEGQNTLINTDAISDLFTNTIETGEDRYLVADIARFGSDKIVLMCFQGLEIYKIIVRTKQGTDVTADLIKQTAIEEQIPYYCIVVDEDGVGGGVVDQCKGIKGFVNNSSPIENANTKPTEVIVNGSLVQRTPRENYQNLRSQCYYMLADYINTHKIAIKTYDVSIQEAITEELEQIIRNHADEDRKLSIVPKEDIKEAIGRSPDYADTLMMRMYFELNPQQEIITKQWKPNFN